MPQTHAATPCFGYRTAFQILRQTEPRDRKPLRSSYAPPDRTPTDDELASHIDLLREAYPFMALDRPYHVLVADARCRRRLARTCMTHVCAAQLSGQPFRRLSTGAAVSAAELAFVHAAALEKNPVSLLELGYELCGSYQTPRTGVPSGYQVPALSSVRAIKDFAARNPSLRGAAKAMRATRYLADGSASPRETKKALVLGLPHMYGGYGLGIPRMNHKVPASPAARALTGKSFFRCDLCWPEAKLDVEYQSRESHAGEENRILDSRRTNALIAMGWTVVCVTNDELDSLTATDAIAETIRKHLGKRPQVRVSGYHARKLKLRRQLGLPVGYD